MLKRYGDIQQSNLDFRPELLELARNTTAAGKETEELPGEEQSTTALTGLFDSLNGEELPIIVGNVVNRIDEVVRGVRIVGWLSTIHANQEVRQSRRKILYTQDKTRDNGVIEKSLEHVTECYGPPP